MIFLTLFILPLLVMIVVALIGRQISWTEGVIQVAVQAGIAAISAIIVYYSNVSDTEVWNGRIVKKEKNEVHCEHSYSCNCHESCTGSGSNRSCSQVCDTCYRHFEDYDWDIYTSNHEEITISRVDDQGKQEPPRWSKAELGEPTAVEHDYVSYIKASPDSLFRRQGLKEKYQAKLPKYPEVSDYYRINRFISLIPNQDHKKWNNGLNEINGDLGARKQANVLVVLTNEGPEYFYALEEHWLGGKKNDIVLVIGMNEAAPAWANVMAWTTSEIFKVKLRDQVMELKEISPEAVLPILVSNVDTYFQRKPMSDFAYLKASIKPSILQWVLSLLIGFGVSGGLAWYFHHNEFEFGEFASRRYR